ncbi:hypothetical protein BDR22DRAFT_884286 [Usnea florida]
MPLIAPSYYNNPSRVIDISTMPRGRPPIERTQEEARVARRAQVRRNVQAYRQRKDSSATSENPHLPPQEPFTFVQEQWGESTSRIPLDKDLDDQKHCDFIEHDQTRHLLGPFGKVRKNPTTSRDPVTIESFKYLFDIPPEINAAQVFRQQLTANAATAFLSAQEKKNTITWDIGPHWSDLIPDLVNRNNVLDSSIQALCLMQISHVKQERWLLRSSLTYYDRALQALREVLAQPTKGFRPEIFAAVMALATYELLHGSDGSQSRGWIHHIEGASSYLNAFPKLDVCSFSHQLSFHFLETICIFDALGARRPSSFSTSKWWQNTVDRFGDQSYGTLLRMITFLPTVLQQCDESMALPAGVKAYERLSDLLQMTFRTEGSFIDWMKMTTAQLSLYQPTVATTLAVTKDTKASPSEFSFPTLYAARLHLLYWSSMILLYESIIHLLQGRQTYSDAIRTSSCDIFDPLENASMIRNYQRLSDAFANNIGQSCRFCLRPEYGVIGKTIVLLPLWIARNHFQDHDEGRARWCTSLLNELGQRNLTFGLRVRKSSFYTGSG